MERISWEEGKKGYRVRPNTSAKRTPTFPAGGGGALGRVSFEEPTKNGHLNLDRKKVGTMKIAFGTERDAEGRGRGTRQQKKMSGCKGRTKH